MNQSEPSIMVGVQTRVCFQATLISNFPQKRKEAAEKRMVTEEFVK